MEPNSTDTSTAQVVAHRCAGCHAVGGLAPPLSSALGPLILAKVEAREMPPGQPSVDTPPLRHDPRLSTQELEIFRSWRAAGYPAFSVSAAQDSSPPDLRLLMAQPYRPMGPGTDEYRCFLLPSVSGWVRAYRWRLEAKQAAHHIQGAVLSAAGRATAAAHDGADGRPGWPCTVQFGDGVETVGSLGAGGVENSYPIEYPEGVGLEIPDGGGLALQVHYVAYRANVEDRSGIDLWFHTAAPPRKVAEIVLLAPTEVPCPTGVAADPQNRCSREWALRQPRQWPYQQAKDFADSILSACHQTLAGHYAQQVFPGPAAAFSVRSACEHRPLVADEVLGAHLHGHTYMRRGALRLDGAPFLTFDRFDWRWEQAFLLQTAQQVSPTDMWDLSCEWDNGTASQWSAVSGQPSGPEPLEQPSYHVLGIERKDEMCSVSLTVVTSSN